MVAFLIVLVLCGGALAILQSTNIDGTVKAIGRIVVIVVLAIYAIRLLAPMLPGLG